MRSNIIWIFSPDFPSATFIDKKCLSWTYANFSILHYSYEQQQHHAWWLTVLNMCGFLSSLLCILNSKRYLVLLHTQTAQRFKNLRQIVVLFYVQPTCCFSSNQIITLGLWMKMIRRTGNGTSLNKQFIIILCIENRLQVMSSVSSLFWAYLQWWAWWHSHNNRRNTSKLLPTKSVKSQLWMSLLQSRSIKEWKSEQKILVITTAARRQ